MGKRKKEAKYTFEGPTLVMDGEFDVYGETWSAQWRATASVAAGEEVRDPLHYAEILEDESDSGLVRFAQWRVLEGNQPVFDVWIAHVDGGIVFEADSAKRAPINIIQGSWQSIATDNDDAWSRVADELSACAPDNLWF